MFRQFLGDVLGQYIQQQAFRLLVGGNQFPGPLLYHIFQAFLVTLQDIDFQPMGLFYRLVHISNGKYVQKNRATHKAHVGKGKSIAEKLDNRRQHGQHREHHKRESDFPLNPTVILDNHHELQHQNHRREQVAKHHPVSPVVKIHAIEGIVEPRKLRYDQQDKPDNHAPRRRTQPARSRRKPALVSEQIHQVQIEGVKQKQVQGKDGKIGNTDHPPAQIAGITAEHVSKAVRHQGKGCAGLYEQQGRLAAAIHITGQSNKQRRYPADAYQDKHNPQLIFP